MVAGEGERFSLAGKSEALVGRTDPVSGVFPDLDLTPHGGEVGGVSRRHIKITFAGNQYFVEDLNSTNGTWLGRTQVQPGARVPLNNGDQLRLGRVVLNFFTG
jgi:pSer/pThr/pTyr-binding forkhead associated (FHA) protein